MPNFNRTIDHGSAELIANLIPLKSDFIEQFKDINLPNFKQLSLALETLTDKTLFAQARAHDIAELKLFLAELEAAPQSADQTEIENMKKEFTTYLTTTETAFAKITQAQEYLRKQFNRFLATPGVYPEEFYELIYRIQIIFAQYFFLNDTNDENGLPLCLLKILKLQNSSIIT